MGVENNEVIIATTSIVEAMEAIREWIDTLSEDFQRLFSFVPALTNGKTTIILAPDGSKKGWELAELGKSVRDEFVEEIEKLNFSDGGNPFNWVEVGYGEFGQAVLRGNCINRYGDEPYVGLSEPEKREEIIREAFLSQEEMTI